MLYKPFDYFFFLKLIATVIFMMAGSNAYAQHDPYEVLFNGATSGEEDTELPATSEELFLDLLSVGRSLFGEITEYGFSAVRYSRRGMRNTERSVTLFGTDLSGNLNSGASYGLWNVMRRSRLQMLAEQDAGWFAGASSRIGRISYGFIPDVVPERTSAGFFTTDRKGRFGAKVSASGYAARNWIYMADVYRRWGRDGTVKGVFTDRTAYSVSVSRLFSDKHSITLFSAGEDSEDGLRSYVTAEAAELRGDNYYNPSWGYQDGKVRNSRVARGFVPVTVLSYNGRIGNKTELTASLSFRGGTESVSGLSWLDAATPYPDYYRYMPSYASSGMAADIITGKWREGDRSVTQLDWNNLYSVNKMNSATSVYTLSDRVGKVRDMQAFIGASFEVDPSTRLGVWVRSGSDNVRRYRRMKDLLGGIATEDIDQYLYEDEIYGDHILNNKREPHRKVNQGDAFGYDYDIFASQTEGLVSAEYKADGLTVSAVAGFGHTTFRRRGNYEKEIYPGGLSYGKSEKIAYETYSGEASVRYGFDGLHSVTGYIYGGRSPQQWGTHFITPMYSNKMTAESSPVTTVSGEAGYSFRGRRVRATATIYYATVKGRNELYNYWDDISSTYTAMHVRGIGEVMQGGEVAVDFDLHPRWNFAAAFAVGSYKYSNDPEVDLYAENTLEKYVTSARTYLKGYNTGTSPETALTTRMSYNGRGISGSLALNYTGGRYVMPSPLRRMQRAYNMTLTDEAMVDFIAQEKLGDVFTVDLTLLKSFKIRDSYLSLFLTVSNLLNDRSIVYSGYEQMRIARTGSGINANWSPFGNKYLWSYGRTYYFSITWSF